MNLNLAFSHLSMIMLSTINARMQMQLTLERFGVQLKLTGNIIILSLMEDGVTVRKVVPVPVSTRHFPSKIVVLRLGL